MLSAAATLALGGAAVQIAHAAPRGGYHGYDVTRNAVYYIPGVDERLRNQRQRIRHARLNGRLTRFEARRAHSALIRIHQAKRWAASDGVIERIERRWMHQMLDRNSLRIRRTAQTIISDGNELVPRLHMQTKDGEVVPKRLGGAIVDER